ncbi:MAG: patatin-like phospholipase family protein [Alphaproteobacteria bacterium]|nr:patatin-like phospholipase family protein [Alphaproteobacteria bacterium]
MSAAVKRVNLALQGGGAHGAFTWGVLDRLLEDERIGVDGIVGTSAGAMNAAVTAYGLAIGGNRGARDALAEFWRKVSERGKSGPLQPSPLDRAMGGGGMEYSPIYQAFTAMMRVVSPYQVNPGNWNPLREVLEEVVDFERLRAATDVKLFLCAANVLTGRLKVFERHEVSAAAVLASGCLPFLFQAVEVDGQHYWDGGYMGNPPIFPVIYACQSRDVVIVQINPVAIPELPTTAQAIHDRINTLSFNSSLMRELRAISFVTKLIDGGFDDGGRLKRMLIHTIDAEDFMNRLSVSSKLNADWDWICRLHELGRARAEDFIARHFDKIGRESSTDIAAKFM